MPNSPGPTPDLPEAEAEVEPEPEVAVTRAGEAAVDGDSGADDSVGDEDRALAEDAAVEDRALDHQSAVEDGASDDQSAVEDRASDDHAAGIVVLAATPIGDVDDAPPRLRALLAEADIVAAEDTRRLHGLLGRLGIRPKGRIVSYHEHNEAKRADELVDAAAGGARVLVVSDAGMPTVSDPGYRVVRAAIDAGVRVTVLPGPSAVLTALAISGLASDRFCFEGFAPRKPGERARWLAALRDEPRTMVLFESPHRTADTLTAMAQAFGPDRPAAVCRELTKTYEEVRRGGVAELAQWAVEGVRGEVTLVVAGAPPRSADPAVAVAEVLERVAAGERLKEAAGDVASALGLSRRGLYEAALAARRS